MDCNHLKVGDPVIVNNSRRGRHVGKVVRITPKQVVVGASNYWKENGGRVGDVGAWVSEDIEPYSETVAASIKKKVARTRIINDINNCRIYELNDQQLAQIHAIIKPSMG